VRKKHPSPALIVSLLALFVALGGPAQAERLFGSKDIKNGSLQAEDLSRKARKSLKQTPDSSVTTAKLVPGSVLTGTIADDNVTAADLAPNSVAVDELANDSVGQAEIRNNGVGAAELADNSIDGGELIDGGLLARDVGRFAGTLIVDFSSLPAGACQAASVTDTPMDTANADISNDLIVLSPAATWPTTLTYGAKSSTVVDQFLIYACNPGNGAAADPPPTTFRYLIVGF
jgi:hypothetical protein